MKAVKVSDTLVEFVDENDKVCYTVEVSSNTLKIRNHKGINKVTNDNNVFGMYKAESFGSTVALSTGYATGPM